MTGRCSEPAARVDDKLCFCGPWRTFERRYLLAEAHDPAATSEFLLVLLRGDLYSP